MSKPTYEVREGDCLAILKTLPDASVDAVVTDPPAGIGFMGKAWDNDKGGRRQWIAWLTEVMRECLRVLKPGGHALVWSLPRTSHWTGTACEDAGFEVRDTVAHINSQGFPKSHDVSKAIEKHLGGELAVVGYPTAYDGAVRDRTGTHAQPFSDQGGHGHKDRWATPVTAATSEAAKQWTGYGTALKPAVETWWLLRKPLEGTVAENVLTHGVGGINIDGCRIAAPPRSILVYENGKGNHGFYTDTDGKESGLIEKTETRGRWPANLILSSEAAEELDAQSGIQKDGVAVQRHGGGQQIGGASKRTGSGSKGGPRADAGFGGSGGASRFFYVAKPSTRERNAGTDGNNHPTVKPIALMRYLVRLVTPPGGLVLDPFTGSGTTGVACALEGFRFLGCEDDSEHAALARKRIQHWRGEAEEPQDAETDTMEPPLEW